MILCYSTGFPRNQSLVAGYSGASSLHKRRRRVIVRAGRERGHGSELNSRASVFVAQREDVNGGGPEGPITSYSVLATGHRGGARTHLPGASPLISRKSEGRRGVEDREREDVSAGFPPPLMGM